MTIDLPNKQRKCSVDEDDRHVAEKNKQKNYEVRQA